MKAWHIIVLIVVLLVVFGAAKLPDIARSLGQSAKVLKKEMRELQDDDATPPPANPGYGQQYGQPYGQAPQGYVPPQSGVPTQGYVPPQGYNQQGYAGPPQPQYQQPYQQPYGQPNGQPQVDPGAPTAGQ